MIFLLLSLVLFIDIVFTITTRNGCSCSEPTCSIGEKSLTPWCNVDKESCRSGFDSDWDECVDPCERLSSGDQCTPIFEVEPTRLSLADIPEGRCVSVRQGKDVCIAGSTQCDGGRLRALLTNQDSPRECQANESLKTCECLLFLYNPSLATTDFKDIVCTLPRDDLLLYERLAQCSPCNCKDSWGSGRSGCFQTTSSSYCEPVNFAQCQQLHPDKSIPELRGMILCEPHTNPASEFNDQRPTQPTTRTPNHPVPGPKTEETNRMWIIVVIILASILILLFAAYWMWKCVVVNRQHQTQLLQMQEQIRTLRASQERTNSMVRGVSNSTQMMTSHSRHSYPPSQPGFTSNMRSPSNQPFVVQGEASYIASKQRATQKRSMGHPPGASDMRSSYYPPGGTAAEPVRQYCPPPQPKWEDEGPENFVDPNEPFGPTPQPSVISVASHNRDSEPQVRQITAGSEGEYV